MVLIIFNKRLCYLYGAHHVEVFWLTAKRGLNEYTRFPHVNEYGKPVLVFDFIEMFRVSIIDGIFSIYSQEP